MGWSTGKRGRLAGLVALPAILWSLSVSAAGLPTASYPHDWDLPLPGPNASIQAITQYISYDVANHAYDADGHRVALDAVTRSLALTQRYFRLFQWAALPRIGFGWQVFLNEARAETTRGSTGDRTVGQGLGDPTLSAGTWIRPTAGSAVAYVIYLDMPVGAAGLSRDYWRFRQSVGYDLQLWNLNIDGAATFVLSSDKKTANTSSDVSPGAAFSHAIRIGYRLGNFFEPFVGHDVQVTGANKLAATGDIVTGRQYEQALTGGLDVKLGAGHKVSAKYEQGLSGENTSVTQALTLRYCYFF